MKGRFFLERYETERLLGEGGMGRVYLAHDRQLDRKVVVKVMHDHIAADKTFRERFQRETLVMARFTHPHAVALYDAKIDAAQGSCIIMEFIQGDTLDAVLTRSRRLDYDRVGRLLRQICEALQHAHKDGIIHRDLKPANIMITEPDTQYEYVKVMDFGLAKLLGDDAGNAVTNAEFAVGTPGYMCPEQARGDEMDGRGDLYSIGVILYEMLIGKLPFAGRDTMGTLLAHANEEAPTFQAIGLAGLVPPPIEKVVQACLAKNPNHRPSNARELAEMYAEAVALVQTHQSNPPMRPVRQRQVRGTGQQPPPEQLSSPKSFSPQPAHQSGPPQAPQPAPSVPPRQPNLQKTQFPATAQTVPATQPYPAGQMLPVGQSGLMPYQAASGVIPGSPSEPVILKSNAQGAPTEKYDPLSLVHHFEAFMPEQLATLKLRGFIQDKGSELVESVPGKISVRFGTKGCVYDTPVRGLSWLGLGRRSTIDMELRLNRGDGPRENQLRVTVIFKSKGADLNTDAAYRAICTQIFIDLRGYLMGQSHPDELSR